MANTSKVPSKIYLHQNLGNDDGFDRYWDKNPSQFEYLSSTEVVKMMRKAFYAGMRWIDVDYAQYRKPNDCSMGFQAFLKSQEKP